MYVSRVPYNSLKKALGTIYRYLAPGVLIITFMIWKIVKKGQLGMSNIQNPNTKTQKYKNTNNAPAQVYGLEQINCLACPPPIFKWAGATWSLRVGVIKSGPGHREWAIQHYAAAHKTTSGVFVFCIFVFLYFCFCLCVFVLFVCVFLFFVVFCLFVFFFFAFLCLKAVSVCVRRFTTHKHPSSGGRVFV